MSQGVTVGPGVRDAWPRMRLNSSHTGVSFVSVGRARLCGAP